MGMPEDIVRRVLRPIAYQVEAHEFDEAASTLTLWADQNSGLGQKTVVSPSITRPSRAWPEQYSSAFFCTLSIRYS